MVDRDEELRGIAADLRERDVVENAFLAPSSDDRLMIVDLAGDGSVPPDVRAVLAECGLRVAGEVYGSRDARSGSFAGALEEVTRHYVLDVRTRKER
ncbi:hypothetical protein ACERIT_05780 [Halopenitus sp. H-Gu1]|uniref:hypothetical protein n=1 Tax=Halopenitus sp. H-Gu1 TaxID=3242697 RepID=UPI00359E93A3